MLRLLCRYNWVIILPAELSAAAVLIGFWDHTTSPAVWITVTMIITIFINMLGAGLLLFTFPFFMTDYSSRQVLTERLSLYSRLLLILNRMPFTHTVNYSSIKVITITGLIILGIVLDLGGLRCL